MNAEAWAVIGVGVALGALILPVLRGIRADMAALSRDVAGLRERMARLEGLIEGWRGTDTRTEAAP